MKKLLIIIVLFVTGCSSKDSSPMQRGLQSESLILSGEQRATSSAQKVLRVTRGMVESGEIIRGGCWDYLDTAFTRAGFSRNARTSVYKSTIKGPYANVNMLRPGDWIYHVNHSYGGVGHSGMFVEWINRKNAIALMLSYAGERRKEPARYKAYDLSSVYNVLRVE